MIQVLGQHELFFRKYGLVFICLYGSVSLCVHAHAERAEEGVISLELEIWAAVSRSTWVLGAKLQPSTRAASALHHGVMSPVLMLSLKGFQNCGGRPAHGTVPVSAAPAVPKPLSI